MEKSQNRKRQHPDEVLQDLPPARRPKSAIKPDPAYQPEPAIQLEPAVKPNFPPAFWDDLSKVHLTPRALREIDRRHNLTRPTTRSNVNPSPVAYSTNLLRFSRHGGPDFCHLRGYPELRGSSYDRDDCVEPSTTATPWTMKTKNTSAYNKDFEQHLADHRIYLPNRRYKNDTYISAPEPKNLSQIQHELKADRASLSPSRFLPSEFKEFRQKDGRAMFEGDVTPDIVPFLCGTATIPNQKNVLFTELKPVTNEGAVQPKPGFFDGARLYDLSLETRNNDQVRSNVVPTNHPSVPIAPNFFLEVMRPEDIPLVARRLVCYNGAYGARAMHTLQNLNEATPSYDGNAYTYSSTYYAGALHLYVHHMTDSAEGGKPEYHMTQARAYALTNSRETFIAGVTAFRNARDVAQKTRTSLIQLANSGARHMSNSTEASATNSVNYEPNTDHGTWDGDETWQHVDGDGTWHDRHRCQDADDALQRHIAENDSSL